MRPRNKWSKILKRVLITCLAINVCTGNSLTVLAQSNVMIPIVGQLVTDSNTDQEPIVEKEDKPEPATPGNADKEDKLEPATPGDADREDELEEPIFPEEELPFEDWEEFFLEDLEWDLESAVDGRTVHTIETMLWNYGYPSFANPYYSKKVTARCGDTIRFIVHEYKNDKNTDDTPMGDSRLTIKSRYIYNGRSGGNWVTLCNVSGRAPGSSSVVVRDSSAGTWYASYSYSKDANDGYEEGIKRCGIIRIEVSGHNYDYQVTTVTEPTCTAAGKRQKSCVCGLSEEEVIPALGHQTPADYNTSANNGTYFKDCSRCGTRLETKQNPYTIKFHGNSGTGSVSDMKMTYGTAAQLPSSGFSRIGYILKGFNSQADGKGTSYPLGQTVKNLTPLYNGMVTLYAMWEAVPYTAVFNPNSGTGGGKVTKGYEQKLGTLPSAKKTGHQFLGWYTQKNGGIQVTEHSLMPLNGATYYAHWKVNQYRISWDTHGGSKVELWNRDYGTKLGKLPKTDRPGYTFEGWYTSDEADGKLISEETMVPLDGATYHAHWDAIAYPIRWDSCGGNRIEAWSRDYETELGKLPEPKRIGYTFAGWYTSKTDGKQISEKTTVPLNGATYYANWKAISYPIVWNSHGGSEVEAWERDYETKLGKLPETNRPGYTFEGWYTSEEADGKQISEETMVPLDGAMYHARWNAISYPIVWDSHGGSGVEAWERDYETKLGKLPKTDRPGYTFEGWYTSEEADGKQISEETTVPLDGATYHARWKAVSYPIRWNSCGGSEVEAWNRDYETELGKLPEPERIGYTFIGWYTSKADGKQISEKTTVPLNGATYYARWKAVSYPIVWDSHGGSEVEAWKRDYETKLGKLPKTDRPGYTFEGWYTSEEADGEQISEETTVPLDGATYHARWKAISYPIVWDSHGGSEVEAWERDYETKLGKLPETDRPGYTFEGWYTSEEADGKQISEETTVPLDGATYHAHWKAVSYPIKWNSCGGSEVETWERDYETKLGKLPETDRPGYTFEGWYTSEEADGKQISEETTVPLDGATYYAHWKAISYPIVWNSHKGSEVEAWERDYETKLGKLPETDRPGYTFEGWYTSEEADGKQISGETTVPLDGATYHARWKVISYPIVWDSHGGSEVETWERDYETKLGKLPETDRPGYTFEGWYTLEEADGELVSEETIVPLDGVTYHAHWKAVSYPISWDSCGGSGVETWERDYETELGKLPESERTGYILEGWKTATSSDAAFISEKTTVPLDGAIYYASWKAKEYPIFWDSMGGILNVKWTRPYETELGELPVPMRYGYKFGGWYADQEFHIPVTEQDRVPLNGATFYAKWIKKSTESEGSFTNKVKPVPGGEALISLVPAFTKTPVLDLGRKEGEKGISSSSEHLRKMNNDMGEKDGTETPDKSSQETGLTEERKEKENASGKIATQEKVKESGMENSFFDWLQNLVTRVISILISIAVVLWIWLFFWRWRKEEEESEEKRENQ